MAAATVQDLLQALQEARAIMSARNRAIDLDHPNDVTPEQHELNVICGRIIDLQERAEAEPVTMRIWTITYDDGNGIECEIFTDKAEHFKRACEVVESDLMDRDADEFEELREAGNFEDALQLWIDDNVGDVELTDGSSDIPVPAYHADEVWVVATEGCNEATQGTAFATSAEADKYRATFAKDYFEPGLGEAEAEFHRLFEARRIHRRDEGPRRLRPLRTRRPHMLGRESHPGPA